MAATSPGDRPGGRGAVAGDVRGTRPRCRPARGRPGAAHAGHGERRISRREREGRPGQRVSPAARSGSTPPTARPASTTIRWSRTPPPRSSPAVSSPCTTRTRVAIRSGRPSPGRLGLPVERVRVISAHVGGGFGSKGLPRPNVILAAMAARELGRPVRVVFTRQHQFSLVGYRTPTIQRVRLGADADGRLRSIDHDAIVQSSRHVEFVEQVVVGHPDDVRRGEPSDPASGRRPRRADPVLDAGAGRVPRHVRSGVGDGRTGRSRLGMDPVELRIRNEPAADPEQGIDFSSRNLVGCLRRGAELFGWADRDPRPRARRRGRWLIGSGVASSTYPGYASPATATADRAARWPFRGVDQRDRHRHGCAHGDADPRRGGPRVSIPISSRSGSVTRICRGRGWPADRPGPRPGAGRCTRSAGSWPSGRGLRRARTR